jgi:hypothetical protein
VRAPDDAALRFHPLAVLEEDGQVVIGRTDIDSYGRFPSEGAALLDQLRAGRRPADAAEWFRTTYGDAVDVGAFVSTLRELGFLRDDAGAIPSAEPRVRWQRLGRAAFSPAAWVGYVALLAGAIAATGRDRGLVPDPGDVLFSDYRIVVLATVFFGQVPLVLVHEAFHVLAARRLGLHSSIRVSHRLYFVVFETVLDGMAVVPRRRRYLPILAGMLADVLVIASLTLVAALAGAAGSGGAFVRGACLALAFTTLLRLGWQFCVFMRTDVYYLLTTATGCPDLHATARRLVANRLNALLDRRERIVDEGLWDPRERRIARWYAPLLVTGYATALVVLVAVIGPLAWEVLAGAVHAVFLADGPQPARFWDSVAVLAVNAVQLGAAATLAMRERSRRAAAR